jgi:DNA-directed RNA polymerase specialized sigma24 family protein
LYVLAYKYLKSTYSSEDAVQQVFLKLWEARSLLMVNVNLRNYQIDTRQIKKDESL